MYNPFVDIRAITYMFNLKQLQNSMSKLQKEVKWIPLTYIYITAHFSGWVQAHQ